MEGRNKYVINYILWFIDMAVVVASFMLSTWIRFGNFRDMEDKALHFYVCVVFMLVGTIYYFASDYNRNILKRTVWQEGSAVLQFDFVMSVGTMVAIYALNLADTFSRLVMGYFVIIDPILALIAHQLVKKALGIYLSSDAATVKLLALTETSNLAETARHLKSQLDINYQLVGLVCLDDDRKGETVENIPVIANREDVVEIVRVMALDEIFIETPNITQNALSDLMGAFRDMGVTVHYSVELTHTDGSARMDNFASYPVISYTRGTGRYRALIIKRLMDIAGGIVGLGLTAIMTPFIALAIKLDSKGPVFFSQIRIGRGGRRFRIYKFRTMVADAEARKAELMEKNEMQGPIFKLSDDPRVTRVGQFLRKTSLDEFPQFWNVLKGDMSLVGTRPPTEEEFKRYTTAYRRRISMTPGLTGLWQISGRSTIEDFDEIVRLDLQYIDNWSLGLDIRILVKTIGVVLFGKGAK